MKAVALPGVDVLDLELARLEGAVPCGDDERPGRERLALVRREDEDLLAVGADPLEVLDLLPEVDVGSELEALLDAEVDERLALDLRVPGDVVDVLLGIDGGDLAAELSEALDDPHGAVAVPAVVRRSEAHRPAADDRDVDDLVLAHAAPRVPGTIAALVAAAGATSAAGVGLHGLAARLVLGLEGRAASTGRLHVRVVDGEARPHERVDEVDLGAGQVGQRCTGRRRRGRRASRSRCPRPAGRGRSRARTGSPSSLRPEWRS